MRLLYFAFLAPSVIGNNINYLSPSINHPFYAVNPPSQQTLLRKRSTSGKIHFSHGIASGDPYSDSVVLWTRAVPDFVSGSAHKYSPSSPIACVNWEISTSSHFSNITNSGQTHTSGDVDYTVKIIADGLSPWTYYWYRFQSCDGAVVSDVGRTKTLPAEDDPVNDGARLAIYSCSNYAEGFFNVFGMSARKDSVDFVLHLGDYIYEMPLPTNLKSRIPLPLKEVIQLRDYRLRFATHRTDADLLLSHAQFPWITIWDDHEIANDGWRGGSASPQWMLFELTTWNSRTHNALRAYFEWMPIRQVSASSSFRIWRTFKLGKLADLIMLDTRYYDRDQIRRPDLRTAEDRSIMGKDQEGWLYSELQRNTERKATWAILGQQIQFSNINETAISGKSKDLPLYWDGWSGYAANRRRVLEKFVEHNVSNPVILTGDYHTLWTADLTWGDLKGYDWQSGDGSLGIEIAVTSVTSSNGYGELNHAQSKEVSRRLVRDNSFLKWAEGFHRGYVELTLTHEKLTAEYFSVPDVTTRNDHEELIAIWESIAGERKLKRPLPMVKEGARQEGIDDWASYGMEMRELRKV